MCVFGAIICPRITKRGETRASSDEEVEEPGFRWISNRVGEESYLGPFVDVDFLSFLSFFFFSRHRSMYEIFPFALRDVEHNGHVSNE